MAIQNRRGDYNDFDPQKLVPGEWAVVLSGDPSSTRGKAVYMAFDAGDVERMATYEDMQENIVSATTDVQAQFADELTQTIADASAAVTNMRSDVDAEIVSATETVNNLTFQVNAATNDARSSTAEALSAADEAIAAAESVQAIIEGGQAVLSWNGRVGVVTPASGDYTSALITHGNTTVADALTFDTAPTANSTRAVQSKGLFTILGNTSMGTTASTITGAVRELLTKINTLTSNVSTLTTNLTNAVSRISPLETKTSGFVATKQYTVAASGGRTYISMHATSAYIVIINAYSTNNNFRGVYLVGAASSNALGIKAISAASEAELVDSGTIGGTSGVLRITNNGSVTMRVTVITTTGTAV